MNVAIIGRGTSSIITTLVLLSHGHNITIFYDPETDYVNVGESTTPPVIQLFVDMLNIDINQLVDDEILSYKAGINFVGWGSNEKFHHNFSGNSIAAHFDTIKFNKYAHDLLSKKDVKYIPEKVISVDSDGTVNSRQFDLVVNCSGWESDDNYYDSVISTVNSALLFRDELNGDNLHTLHLATEDGWQFGLPFPNKNIMKCGYLFDSNLISKDEVASKLGREICGEFSWKPRYAKKFISGKIAMNGNRLFFFEPLQALSLHYTLVCANLIAEYLRNPQDSNMNHANACYLEEMWSYQLTLAYHYQFGSKYKTKFWNSVQKQSQDFLKYSFKLGNSEIFETLLNFDKKYNTRYSVIGHFDHLDHRYIYDKMNNTKEVN